MSVNHFPYLPLPVTNLENNPCIQTDPDRQQNLITCSLAYCQPDENFILIRSEVFAQSC